MIKETEKRIFKLVNKVIVRENAQLNTPNPPTCSLFFHQPKAVRRVKSQNK
jgi:hypothetical protein